MGILKITHKLVASKRQRLKSKYYIAKAYNKLILQPDEPRGLKLDVSLKQVKTLVDSFTSLIKESKFDSGLTTTSKVAKTLKDLNSQKSMFRPHSFGNFSPPKRA